MVSRGKVLAVASVSTTTTAVVLLAVTMASHMPFAMEPAAAAIERRRTGHWQAVYVLSASCVCSASVVRHLAASPRLAGIDEQVAWVGDGLEKSTLLRRQGLKVVPSSAREVRELYGARNTPLLVFVDPAGAIRYAGGFARRNDFRDGFQETQLWTDLQQGRPVNALPPLGCALRDGSISAGADAILGL